MVVREDCDRRDENATDENATDENATNENTTNENTTNENTTDCLYLIFYIIDRETKELLPYGIFIITRRY